MNLVVDVGNTRLKYAFFSKGKGMGKGLGELSLFRETAKLKEAGESLAIFLSGSGKIGEELRSGLRCMADFWLEASADIPLPLKIGYTTPETLGFDRVAICTAAYLLFPDKDLLVIDTGTAFTYNYVEKGFFLGGNISPGVEMRFKALNIFTEKLPYVESEGIFGEYGGNTVEAIRSGVLNGLFFEVQGYITEFYRSHPQGQVLLTGGSCLFFKEKFGETIYFHEELGVKGLNEILEFNKKVN